MDDANDKHWELMADRCFDNALKSLMFAVMADGIKDLTLIAQLRNVVNCPMFCNVIDGGKA